MKIKEIVIKSKIKALCGKPRRKAFMELKDVQRIALLFDAENYDQAIAFKHELESMGKKVRAWSYAEVSMPEWEYLPSQCLLTRKHLNFFYQPKQYIVDDYQGYPADMLLFLSLRKNLVMEYFSLLSPAPFRVSFNTARAKEYDFVLAPLSESCGLRENAESLLFYLKNLRLK